MQMSSQNKSGVMLRGPPSGCSRTLTRRMLSWNAANLILSSGNVAARLCSFARFCFNGARAHARFLYEPNTREGRYYAQVSASLRVESEVKQICNDSSSVPTNTSMSAAAAAASAVAAVRSTSYPSAGTRVLNEGEDGSADARPEKRRNRWGPAVDGHLPQAPPPGADASESYQRSMPRDYTVALPETRDQASEQQLKVQREMQQLEQRIRDAAAEQKRAQMTPFDDLKEERRREYEMLASQSDEHRDTAEDADRNLGIIDGGTWEHRKRAREMLSTADGSDDLTELNRGKHHIAQFLPKEELDNFLKSADVSDLSLFTQWCRYHVACLSPLCHLHTVRGKRLAQGGEERLLQAQVGFVKHGISNVAESWLDRGLRAWCWRRWYYRSCQCEVSGSRHASLFATCRE